jgi:hypothetical protein
MFELIDDKCKMKFRLDWKSNDEFLFISALFLPPV